MTPTRIGAATLLLTLAMPTTAWAYIPQVILPLCIGFLALVAGVCALAVWLGALTWAWACELRMDKPFAYLGSLFIVGVVATFPALFIAGGAAYLAEQTPGLPYEDVMIVVAFLGTILFAQTAYVVTFWGDLPMRYEARPLNYERPDEVFTPPRR